jgi:GPR1/FUN34/yaaH family
MMLAIAYLQPTASAPDVPNIVLLKVGGYLGLIAAGLAWYNAIAGFDDLHNRYVLQFSLWWRGEEREEANICGEAFLLFLWGTFRGVRLGRRRGRRGSMRHDRLVV